MNANRTAQVLIIDVLIIDVLIIDVLIIDVLIIDVLIVDVLIIDVLIVDVLTMSRSPPWPAIRLASVARSRPWPASALVWARHYCRAHPNSRRGSLRLLRAGNAEDFFHMSLDNFPIICFG